jgi:hypothetical protein
MYNEAYAKTVRCLLLCNNKRPAEGGVPVRFARLRPLPVSAGPVRVRESVERR